MQTLQDLSSNPLLESAIGYLILFLIQQGLRIQWWEILSLYGKNLTHLPGKCRLFLCEVCWELQFPGVCPSAVLVNALKLAHVSDPQWQSARPSEPAIVGYRSRDGIASSAHIARQWASAENSAYIL